MSWHTRSSRRRNPDDAMDREIAFHVEELVRSYLVQGMTPEEARRRALV